MLETIKSYLTVRNAIYFFSFIAGWPCVFYLMGWLPNYQINYLALFGILIVYGLRHNNTDSIPSNIKNILTIQIVSWVIFSFIHMDTSYYTRILYLLITFMILKMQYNDSDTNRFVNTYNFWITLQVVCGTLGVMLVLSGILHPIFKFREMDGRMGYFFGLFTTNTYFGDLVRNAGYFDEPGALACWGIYALLFNKLFVKNKIIEYALLIGLVSTFSFAYFIQVAAYLLTFYRERSWKFIMTVATILIVMKIFASYNEEINNAIFGRFQYNEESGSINGDNRSDLFASCWKIFCNYPIFGIGARVLASEEIREVYGFVGANFLTGWASDGIVGALISYLPALMIFRLGRSNKKYYGVGVILFLGFLQRPYDGTQLLFPLLTYAMLLHGYEHEILERYEEDEDEYEQIDDSIEEII